MSKESHEATTADCTLPESFLWLPHQWVCNEHYRLWTCADTNPPQS